MRRLPRSAGVLLHPTSLPGPGGTGTLGAPARRFAETLAQAGVTLWQMLPLGPPGYGDSPYQCFSAFAGDPRLVEAAPGDEPASGAAFDAWVAQEADWLEDYALFMAIKDAHDGAAWTDWPAPLALRDPDALTEWRARLALEVQARRAEQYRFARQFAALRAHCRTHGIRLMGDLPIYVAHDSADVWAHRRLFKLRADGRPAVQAGVPPDYFSATGQLWGNPIYDWEAARADGFAWWVRRLRAAAAQFDLVRIDHFRGFESHWEVAADATTAVGGRWVEGPRQALFDAVHAALGDVAIVAEDLGIITPAVDALRRACGFPGMKVLQFAFGAADPERTLRPHGWEPATVVYTGTHDNDTSRGWWSAVGAAGTTQGSAVDRAERALARRYLGMPDDDPGAATDPGVAGVRAFVRAALASVCDTAIIPWQDVLELGSEARMNQPGRAEGNWGWRFTWEQVEPAALERLRALIALYQRDPVPPRRDTGRAATAGMPSAADDARVAPPPAAG